VILDVTDPAKPSRVGAYRPPGRTERVRVVGNRAYLATSAHAGGGCEQEGWRGPLVILGVSDPASPGVLGTYSTGHTINSWPLDGDQVFLIDGYRFYAVDISDPARPVTLRLGSETTSVPWAGRQQIYGLSAI
jgi:hypothetical protein